MNNSEIQTEINDFNVEEMSSLVLEKMNNGEIINWNYWAGLNNITPIQCAKLYHRIDPIKCPGDNCNGQKIIGSEKENIDRLCQQLEGYSERWSLTELVSFLSKQNGLFQKAPFGMIEAINFNVQYKSEVDKYKDVVNDSFLTADVIADLWSLKSFYKDESRSQLDETYRKLIEDAIINGELTAKCIEKRTNVLNDARNGYDREYQDITNCFGEIQRIKDGWITSNKELSGEWVQYTIERYEFYNWLKRTNHVIDDDCSLSLWLSPCLAQPKTIYTSGVGANIDDNLTELTKREKQQKAILSAIGIKKYDPMAIPDGGKGTIKRICEEDNPLLFDGETSFDNAWRNGRALFRMANHASYSKRGNQ